MLSDKKLLITGVITRDSIAWEAARQAQEAGRGSRAHRASAAPGG